MDDRHDFLASRNPRMRGCERCGRPKGDPLHGGKRILVHPASRRAAEPQIRKLDLPVEESRFMPRGKLYIIDPAEILPIRPDPSGPPNPTGRLAGP